MHILKFFCIKFGCNKIIVVLVIFIFFWGDTSFGMTRGRTRNLADVPCGQQWKRGSRIIGGQNASPGEFPWLVSIKRRGGHFCGGTIVNKRWVITAGHCMCSGPTQLSEEHIRVTVGEHDLKSKDNTRTVDKKISKIHFYPEYRCSKFVHDIALLELENDIYWTRSVAPACLPLNPGSVGYSDFSDRSATAAGWGWLSENYSAGSRSDILQKVQVTVVDNDKCRDWYSSQGKKVKILDSQICAGNEAGGRDSCWADSGGPLMVPETEGMMVVGVVSTGIGCGRPRLPGLYTRMSEYMPWILKVIKGNLRQSTTLNVLIPASSNTQILITLPTDPASVQFPNLQMLPLYSRTTVVKILCYKAEVTTVKFI